MDKIKIIITGSNGFIGSNLINHLISLGEFIIHEINEDIFISSTWKKDLEKIIIDFKPEFVFHVGACSNTLETDVNYIMVRNVEFTKNLCDLSKKYLFNIIYSSSASVYGSNNTHPSNLYGWTKYISEFFIKKTNGISLRYFNVYGPGEEHKGNMSSIIYQSYIKHKKGEIVRLFPGSPKRDFIYINDVVLSNIYALQNFKTLIGGTYEVGTGVSNTFEKKLQTLDIPFGYYDYLDIPDGYQFLTCSSKENWMPGWLPIFDLEKGLNHYKNYLIINS